MINEKMNRKNAFEIHKFGGTSVGDTECFRKVQNIIESSQKNGGKVAVVVSGMGGKPKVTDLLIGLVELAKERKEYLQKIEQLKDKHFRTIDELLVGDDLVISRLKKVIEQDIEQLIELLKAIAIMKSYNENIMEFICGHGELWSAQILAALLNKDQSSDKQFLFVDARKVLIVEQDSEHGPIIQWEQSKSNIDELLSSHPEQKDRLVITGFICSDINGITTTLKRDGSDYSASIFGRILKASRITIWTDVNGVLSADPRRVPEAKILDNISYKEAMELAYFGAKVIHPKTMTPAIVEEIPIFIRNTFDPKNKGTRIFLPQPKAVLSIDSDDLRQKVVSGFSTVDNLALFNLEGGGMVGVNGVSSRLFSALDQVKINVVLIAQASSEHSICFAIPNNEAEKAKEIIEGAFFKELHYGHVDKVEYISPVSIIAAVGDNMSHSCGVCARFFGALGHASINVLAISQGSSERNISAVVKSEESANALRAVHSAFFLSDQTIAIGVLGADTPSGQAFLSQLYAQSKWLRQRYNVDIRLLGMVNSKSQMCHHPIGMDISSINSLMDAFQWTDFDLDKFTQHVRVDYIPHSLILDLTLNEDIVTSYTSWLEKGCHIVSNNSFAGCQNLELYKQMYRLTYGKEKYLNIEPSIGAGFPIVYTMNNFLQTGDRIHYIQLNFQTDSLRLVHSILFDLINDSPENEILKKVEDLCLKFTVLEILEEFSGKFLARKLVIIAREIGLQVELSTVVVDSILQYPSSLEKAICDWNPSDLLSYLKSLVHLDEYAHFRALLEDRAEFRLIGTIDAKTQEIVIKKKIVTASDNKNYSENVIEFWTSRFNTHPLVMSGPLTTPEMMAGVAFSGLLDVTRRLGARDHGANILNYRKSQQNHPKNLVPFSPEMSPSQSFQDLHSLAI